MPEIGLAKGIYMLHYSILKKGQPRHIISITIRNMQSKTVKKNFQFTSAWSLLHSRRLRYIHLIDMNQYILSWLCYVHQNWYISKEHQLLEINIKNHVIVIRDNVVWETNIPPHFSTRSGRSRSRSCYNSRLFTAISSSSTPCKKLMSLKIF